MPELTHGHLLERVGWFEELGFTREQAADLAPARDSAGQLVTAHEVRRALERGCDHAAAVAIFA